MKCYFSRLSSQPHNNIISYCVVGADYSYIEWCGEQIVQQYYCEYEIHRLSGEAFQTDPAATTHQQSLFGGGPSKKLYILTEIKDGLSSALAPYLEEEGGEQKFILLSDAPATLKKLRALHEKSARGVFTQCYLSQPGDISAAVSQLIKKYHLALDQEAINYCRHQLQACGFAAVDQALQKLRLYSPPTATSIDSTMVAACFAGDENEITQTLVYAIADQNLEKTAALYQRALLQGQEPIMIMRMLSRHLQSLLYLLASVEKGVAFAQACMELRPPMFFKVQEIAKLQLKRWNANKLYSALQQLGECELAIKQGFPSPEMRLWQGVQTIVHLT